MSTTEPNSTTKKNSLINDTLSNVEFIGYINALSKAILEFYKVSKNINSNKNLLINNGKKELTNENIFQINIVNGNVNHNNIILIQLIQTLSDIFNQLEFNNKSQEQNLWNFFEDSKILFKKLKEKRYEIMSRNRSNFQASGSSRNSFSRRRAKFDTKQIITQKNENIKPDNNPLYRNKSVRLKAKQGKSAETKGKSSRSSIDLKNDGYFNETSNILNTRSEYGVRNPIKNIINISKNELNKLRNINQKITSDLKKRSNSNSEYKVEGIQNNTDNNFENMNLFIKDKDKLITTLKKEIKQKNKNYNIALNKYKNQVINLKKENNQLKSNYSYSLNMKNEMDKSMISKLSNLMKENQQLKNNLEELKMSNIHYDYDTNIINMQRTGEENNFNKKESDFLKNRIKILENKFKQKQVENSELNNKIKYLQNKFEGEKLSLTKKNSELSANLINKENEILSLRKTSFNAEQNLSNMILNANNNQNKNMNNIENIQQMKKDFEIKIFRFNNKIKDLESNLEKSNKLKFEQNNKIATLNQLISEKDSKLLEQSYELEKFKFNLSKLKIENQKLLKDINNLKDNRNNTEYPNSLNEKLRKQLNLNKDLNEQLLKIKNENEFLKKNNLSKENKISNLNEYANAQKSKDNEIESLKNEIQSLKFENEHLNYRIKQYKENIVGFNGDKANKQIEEIEGLKQLIQKLTKEREKGDSEIMTLKRENEKIKNQIVRLSKTLPEEYNELQKQYKELETKYQTLKNKNLNTTQAKNKNETKPDKNYEKELTEQKKEIETLKKKNAELFEQLEDKEFRKNNFENRSEDANKSNYEEEFDLRKMAKGAKEKNRSQDINIDYPGIQTYKEKVRELEFYYNSLENLVKKLLLTIQCNPKNKTYVTELCKIVGFDLETTNKIITNKNKNFILGLFSKQ